MDHAAVLIQTIDSHEWNADLYGALASVSKIASSIKNKANTIRLAGSLSKMNKQLDSLFKEIHDVIEGKTPADPKAAPVTEQRANEMAGDLTRLHHSLEYIYEQMRRAGLTNNSRISGQLEKLRSHAESFLDIADWIEASLQTEEVSAIFERASQERERGEVHDLNQVM